MKKKNEIGASLVEYTLLVALISVISMSGVTAFGEQVNDKLEKNASLVLLAGADTGISGCGPLQSPEECELEEEQD